MLRIRPNAEATNAAPPGPQHLQPNLKTHIRGQTRNILAIAESWRTWETGKWRKGSVHCLAALPESWNPDSFSLF